METTYNETFSELERRICRNQTFAICRIIKAKAEQYSKVLYNGREIYKQSVGDQHERLYTLRMRLWSKVSLLNDLVSDILDNSK